MRFLKNKKYVPNFEIYAPILSLIENNYENEISKIKKFVLVSCGRSKTCVPAKWCPFAVYLNDTAYHSEDPEEKKRASLEFIARRCFNETHQFNITACAPWDSIMTNLKNVSLPYKFRK